MVALYAGYFDPFTLGHRNIVERAEKTFDRVIVAIASDSPKKGLFSVDERTGVVKDIFKKSKNVEVQQFEGLLIAYAIQRKVNVLLRGIRTVSDFEYEYQMALANKKLAPEIETLFMMTEGEYSYLSSTLIKELARLNGDLSKMVPPQVIELFKKKYAS